MKTTTKAAILLLSGTIFFSHASLAGNKDKPDKGDKPVPEDCDLFPVTYSVCALALSDVHRELGVANEDPSAFKNSKDYVGLRCKVVNSQNKMSQDKPADALLKLEDSLDKIGTLRSQRKLEPSAADSLEWWMGEAIKCVEAEIPPTP